MQEKMMKKLGLSLENFEPVDQETLLEEAYLKAEYNSILIEALMEDET